MKHEQSRPYGTGAFAGVSGGVGAGAREMLLQGSQTRTWLGVDGELQTETEQIWVLASSTPYTENTAVFSYRFSDGTLVGGLTTLAPVPGTTAVKAGSQNLKPDAEKYPGPAGNFSGGQFKAADSPRAVMTDAAGRYLAETTVGVDAYGGTTIEALMRARDIPSFYLAKGLDESTPVQVLTIVQ